MEILRIVNEPVPSNTYILYEDGTGECTIVDPGSKESTSLIELLDHHHLKPTYILLTHEHFDHVWSVNDLIERFGAKVICSQTCKEKISTPQNYFNKLYFNSDEYFSVDRVYRTIEELNFEMKIREWHIRFIKTPGHSSSSICIDIDGRLFTGDTIMNGYKPLVLKRHEGSKEELNKSVKAILDSYVGETIIYPGHGDIFQLKECEPFYAAYFSK